LCRFIFCRAIHSLFKPTNRKEEFLPTCMPPLPELVDAESMLSQSCVMQVASFFDAVNRFSFAELTTWPDTETEEAVAKEGMTDGRRFKHGTFIYIFLMDDWACSFLLSHFVFIHLLMRTRVILATTHSCLVPHIKQK
jgi:hypothetical protein